jgi:hypothetical protein
MLESKLRSFPSISLLARVGGWGKLKLKLNSASSWTWSLAELGKNKKIESIKIQELTPIGTKNQQFHTWQIFWMMTMQHNFLFSKTVSDFLILWLCSSEL